MPRPEIRIEIGEWSALREAVVPIRWTVFVDEQKVPPEMEIDEWDAASLHALAHDPDGRAVGTARLLPDGHIGRIAVLKESRGSGVGSALLLAMMRAARERGHPHAMLNAQTQAVAFYQRHGFVAAGDVYDDAGIAHIAMRRAL